MRPKDSAGRRYFPDHLEMMIKHMVLSHHGYRNTALLVKPLFPEALLLHTADNLDAVICVYKQNKGR